MEWDFELSEIDKVAAQFRAHCGAAKVVAFKGEMGAGKTTFIAALCKVMGVKASVASPTFALIYEYQCSTGTLYHMDLYRLNSEEDALRAGVDDALWSGETCFVEWPERVPGWLPDSSLNVSITTLPGNRRRLVVSDY